MHHQASILIVPVGMNTWIRGYGDGETGNGKAGGTGDGFRTGDGAYNVEHQDVTMEDGEVVNRMFRRSFIAMHPLFI